MKLFWQRVMIFTVLSIFELSPAPSFSGDKVELTDEKLATTTAAGENASTKNVPDVPAQALEYYIQKLTQNPTDSLPPPAATQPPAINQPALHVPTNAFVFTPHN